MEMLIPTMPLGELFAMYYLAVLVLGGLVCSVTFVVRHLQQS